MLFCTIINPRLWLCVDDLPMAHLTEVRRGGFTWGRKGAEERDPRTGYEEKSLGGGKNRTIVPSVFDLRPEWAVKKGRASSPPL